MIRRGFCFWLIFKVNIHKEVKERLGLFLKSVMLTEVLLCLFFLSWFKWSTQLNRCVPQDCCLFPGKVFLHRNFHSKTFSWEAPNPSSSSGNSIKTVCIWSSHCPPFRTNQCKSESTNTLSGKYPCSQMQISSPGKTFFSPDCEDRKSQFLAITCSSISMFLSLLRNCLKFRKIISCLRMESSNVVWLLLRSVSCWLFRAVQW